MPTPSKQFFVAPPNRVAEYKLNHENYCTSSFGATWTRTLPDTCIPAIDDNGRRYNTLEVINQWPVCENGTDAKLGVFAHVGDEHCNLQYLCEFVEKKHVKYRGCFSLVWHSGARDPNLYTIAKTAERIAGSQKSVVLNKEKEAKSEMIEASYDMIKSSICAI